MPCDKKALGRPDKNLRLKPLISPTWMNIFTMINDERRCLPSRIFVHIHDVLKTLSVFLFGEQNGPRGARSTLSIENEKSERPNLDRAAHRSNC